MNKKDFEFIKKYPNKYGPMGDYYNDLLGPYNRLPELFKDLCTPKMESMRKELEWARNKLEKLKIKYGDKEVNDILDRFDGYSN